MTRPTWGGTRTNGSSAVTFIVSLLFTVVLALTVHADAPFIDPSEDEKYFGDALNTLFWTLEEKVSGFRNMDRLTYTRKVEASDSPSLLPYRDVEFRDFQFDYDSQTYSVDDYIRRHNVAGLLVIKDGSVVLERYELGNSAESRWISYSVAKSVTSLLVGAAIEDGYIESVDEKVSDYLPRLKNSSYDDVTIRHLLQMTSGVEWNEDYADPESDISMIEWDTLNIYGQLKIKPRVAEPGALFNYNTAEINLVGTLVRAAIGNNLSTYLTEKVWKPFGMEFDASWNLTEEGGGEFGGSSLNATLRDYGRIGLFALNDGRLQDGTRVVPDGWMADSTTPSEREDRYGYLWWIRGEGEYAASGIFGQAIHIAPRDNLVIAQHSARESASMPEDWAFQLAFFRAITAHLDK